MRDKTHRKYFQFWFLSTFHWVIKKFIWRSGARIGNSPSWSSLFIVTYKSPRSFFKIQFFISFPISFVTAERGYKTHSKNTYNYFKNRGIFEKWAHVNGTTFSAYETSNLAIRNKGWKCRLYLFGFAPNKSK